MPPWHPRESGKGMQLMSTCGARSTVGQAPVDSGTQGLRDSGMRGSPCRAFALDRDAVRERGRRGLSPAGATIVRDVLVLVPCRQVHPVDRPPVERRRDVGGFQVRVRQRCRDSLPAHRRHARERLGELCRGLLIRGVLGAARLVWVVQPTLQRGLERLRDGMGGGLATFGRGSSGSGLGLG